MGVGHGVPENVAEYRAYYGGLKIRTTLDLGLQQAADQAISQELPYGEGLPGASLVAIDNKTGQVRAMVGGPIVNGQEDYNQFPFNLATEARRQPGSSFKPFTLAMALESGKYGPDSIIDSAPQNFVVPNSGGKEHFIVHNFGDTYSGPITLADATDISDNTVYSQVGINVGTKKIAKFAKRAGIRTPVSDNYAMILGGLKIGVSPLDMAHAYETFAEGGRRVWDPVLGAPHKGPTGIAQIYCPSVCPHKNLVDHPAYERVLPASIAAVVHEMLTGVVQHGTGTSAEISGVDVAGKTGTTTDYADAWFVGWTPELTTAVWVGYPNKLVPMTTAYNGAPVEGGTYPAIIWHNFMVQALQILATENPHQKITTDTTTDTTSAPSIAPTGTDTSTTPTSTTPAAPTGGATGNTGGGGTGNGGATGNGGTTGTPGAGRRRRRRPDDGHARRRRTGCGCGHQRRRRHRRWWRNRWRWRLGRRRTRRRVRLARPSGRGDSAPRTSSAARPWTDLNPRQRRPRQEPAVDRGEAPRQLGGLRDSDPPARDDLDIPPRRRPAGDHDRPSDQVGAVELESDPQRLRELARPRAQVLDALDAAALAHQLDPLDRLERADQHRGADALGLADRVQTRVDPVREVHVGTARRAEQDAGAVGQADERVGGGLGVVIRLGLDDHPRRALVREHASDQVLRHLHNRAVVEARLHPSAARARSSCSRTRARLVPP